MFSLTRFILAPLLVLGLAAPEARAFDWAGKLERDLKLLQSPSATLRKRGVHRLSRYSKAKIQRHVLRALRDIDPGVQLAAASVAAQKKMHAAVPLLIGWMSQWDDSLRLAAASALGSLGGKAALRTLVRALVDPEPKVRLRIVNALAQMGKKTAVVPLVGRLEDTNAGVRLAAVAALGTLADKRAVIPLMGRLGDLGRQIRAASVRALGKLGDPRSGPAITRLLSDHASTVVLAAINTLGKLRYKGATEPLIELLQSGHSSHREAVAQALAQIGSDLAIRSLVAALQRSGLKAAAKRALGRATKQNAKHINVLLKDPKTPRQVAVVAVEIARDAKLVGAVPLLIEQLQLKRLPRQLLVTAIGAIGDPRGQRALLGLLDDPSVDIRIGALKALATLVDGRAAEPLTRQLASPNRRVRGLAISFLGRLRARTATLPLIALLGKADLEESRRAAAALATIGDPRALDKAVELLTHRDRLLRRTAVQAIANLQGKRLPKRKEVARGLVGLCKRQTHDVRANCLQALGNLLRGTSDAEVLSYLITNLQLNDHTLFLSALDGVSAMRDPRIVDALARRIPDLPLVLKRHAVEALGTQPAQRKRSIPLLQALLEDKESVIRGAAAWALVKLRGGKLELLGQVASGTGWAARVNATAALAGRRHPAARDILRRLARDRDPYVRANAMLGLAWLKDKGASARFAHQSIRDRSPWARINALRGLLWLGARDIDAASQRYGTALDLAKHLANNDPDGRIRGIAGVLAKGARAFREQRTWIGLYLLDRDDRPLRDKPFVLITPDGLVKAAHADVRSQAWEEGLLSGRCHVELPARRPGVATRSTGN